MLVEHWNEERNKWVGTGEVRPALTAAPCEALRDAMQANSFTQLVSLLPEGDGGKACPAVVCSDLDTMSLELIAGGASHRVEVCGPALAAQDPDNPHRADVQRFLVVVTQLMRCVASPTAHQTSADDEPLLR